MRKKLTSALVSFDEAGGSCILGFLQETTEETVAYLILERSMEPENDEGIYVEVDDQRHSGYGLVASLHSRDGELELTLTQPLGDPPAELITVEFDDTPHNRERLRRGLERILYDVPRR